MKFAIYCSLFCLSFLSQLIPSQAQEGGATVNQRPIWEVTFPDEGSYAVALPEVISVSMHNYLLDGALKVTEVNLVTTGSALVRFYFIEPKLGAAGNLGTTQRAQDLLKQGQERGGSNIAQAVHKKYPLTTHSKTIEYSLPSLQSLKELHQSVKNAWLKQQEGKLLVR